MFNKKILILVLLAIVIILPSVSCAQPTLQSMANSFADTLFAVGTSIVVIFWVVTGVLYMSSLGNPGRLKAANMSLFVSIVGTILIVLAKVAAIIVGNSLRI